MGVKMNFSVPNRAVALMEYAQAAIKIIANSRWAGHRA
jgi:hypothetical protein